MPINPNIPEAFIAAYAYCYQPKVVEPSFANTASTFIKSTSFTLLGKMTPDQKAKSCEDIISLFKANLSVDEWIELTYTLGEKARLHQVDKNRVANNITPSHLSQALHAARSYIVSCLATDPAYQATYTTTLKLLSAQLNEKDQSIIKNRRSISIDVGSLVKDRDTLLIKLAYLGDDLALNRCIDQRLFDYMPRLNDDPANTPFYMQKDYYQTHYDKNLKPMLHEDLDCFFSNAEKRNHPFHLKSHDIQIPPKLNLVETITPKELQASSGVPIPTLSQVTVPEAIHPPVQTNIDQLFTTFSLPRNMVSSLDPSDSSTHSPVNTALSTSPRPT